MSQYLYILGLALLPAAGNFAGGLVAEFFRVCKPILSYALHLAAGVLFIAAIEEMVAEAHREYDKPLAGIFLVVGFALFALVTSYLGEA